MQERVLKEFGFVWTCFILSCHCNVALLRLFHLFILNYCISMYKDVHKRLYPGAAGGVTYRDWDVTQLEWKSGRQREMERSLMYLSIGVWRNVEESAGKKHLKNWSEVWCAMDCKSLEAQGWQARMRLHCEWETPGEVEGSRSLSYGTILVKTLFKNGV